MQIRAVALNVGQQAVMTWMAVNTRHSTRTRIGVGQQTNFEACFCLNLKVEGRTMTTC